MLAEDLKDPGAWTIRMLLGVGAVLTLSAAVVLEVISLRYHQVTKVITDPKHNLTETVTGPSGPPTALVTATIAGFVVLFLAAAFFNHITDISLPGGIVIKFGAALAKKAADRAQGDPAMTQKIIDEVASQVSVLDARNQVSTNLNLPWNTILDDLVSNAAQSAEREDTA